MAFILKTISQFIFEVIMLLTEIADWVVDQTGQHVLGDLDSLEINMTKFWRLVRVQLGYYGKYRPMSKRQNVYLQNSPYKFPPDNAPDWISTCVPSEYASPIMNLLYTNNPNGPVTWVWRYDKPGLYYSGLVSGQVEVHMHWNNYPYSIEYEPEDEDKPERLRRIVDVDIPAMNYNHDKFLELCRGKFLESIGMSRRAMTLQDVPYQMDSAELVADGREIYSNAKESIEERNDWYLAIR
jgi:hypothetical protein